jgi:hypothetical protein
MVRIGGGSMLSISRSNQPDKLASSGAVATEFGEVRLFPISCTGLLYNAPVEQRAHHIKRAKLALRRSSGCFNVGWMAAARVSNLCLARSDATLEQVITAKRDAAERMIGTCRPLARLGTLASV